MDLLRLTSLNEKKDLLKKAKEISKSSKYDGVCTIEYHYKIPGTIKGVESTITSVMKDMYDGRKLDKEIKMILNQIYKFKKDLMNKKYNLIWKGYNDGGVTFNIY